MLIKFKILSILLFVSSCIGAQNIRYDFNKNDSLCCDSLVVKKSTERKEELIYWYKKSSFIYCKAFRVNGKIHGKVKCFTNDGKLSSISVYKNGVKNGVFKIYTYPKNKKKLLHQEKYKRGKKHGQSISYSYPESLNNKRILLEKNNFKNGKFNGGTRYFPPDW